MVELFKFLVDFASKMRRSAWTWRCAEYILILTGVTRNQVRSVVIWRNQPFRTGISQIINIWHCRAMNIQRKNQVKRYFKEDI